MPRVDRFTWSAAPVDASADLSDGDVLVATEIRREETAETVRCPAAEILAGVLTRAGIGVRLGPMEMTKESSGFRMAGRWLTDLDGAADGTTSALAVGAAATSPELWHEVDSALDSCARTAGERTILLASPRSFCAGVERAIEVVERLLDHRESTTGGPVYVRGEIVHNTTVLADLRRRGAIFVRELDEIPVGETVVFAAHGVSPAVRELAAARELTVVDATCPLVTKVHTEAKRFAARGDTVVLIGHAGHEEVEGTLGEAPDSTVLVETAEDVAKLPLADDARISYLTQTTLAADETTEVIEALRDRFPHTRAPASDDICYATTNRQHALEAVAGDADLVLVVGSENSSNSQRLVEVTNRNGTPAYLIDAVTDIRPEWLADVRTVGLTAGASAPPRLVEAVIDALGGLGPVTISERVTTVEDVYFAAPSALRRVESANRD